MRRARSTSIALFLLALAAGTVSAEQEERPDSELSRRIEESNQDVKAARLRLEAAKTEAGFFARSLLPTVRASAGGETFETGSFDRRSEPFGEVEAVLNLFNGGRDRREDGIRARQFERAEAEYALTLLSAIQKARVAAADARHAEASMRVLDGALDRNRDFLRLADRRIRSGLSTETDRIEAELNGSQLEQDKRRASLDLADATRRLADLLGGTDPGVRVTAPTAHVCPTDLLATPVDASRALEVRAVTLEAETAHLKSRIAGTSWTPSLDLYGGYALYTFREREYASRRDRDDTFAGARVSSLLFDGRQGRADAAAARLRSQALSAESERLARSITAEAETLRRSLVELDAAFHGAEEGVRKSDLYLKNVEREYERGVKNLPDLLAALTRTVELRRRLTETARDLEEARAAYQFLLGL